MDIREFISYGLKATHTRVLRCVEDVSDDEARRSLAGNLAPVVWQVGHLTLADAGFLKRAGGAAALPPSFQALFATGTGGPADYPPLPETAAAFDAVNRSLASLVQSADLTQPVEARNYSSLGEMFIFCCYHRGYHVGKLATLRALLGKPRLFG